MNKIDKVRAFIREEAQKFGAKIDGYNKSYIERNNTGAEALNDNGAYFGFILPDEEQTGPYHDFSLVIFPTHLDKAWIVCLGIGSSGFKNDYELSTYPGVRRLFSKLIDYRGFCKIDFSDIETGLAKTFLLNDELQHLRTTIKKYSSVLPVCQIIDDPLNREGKKILSAFVAAYAKLRDWPSNNEHRKAVSLALKPFLEIDQVDDFNEIENLLIERRFIVLQGSPGTGKTTAAKAIVKKLKAKDFFIQFHAETTYSEFIYGLRPKINSVSLTYTEKKGKFSEAIEYAQKHPEDKVILIVDEINRANLSNVLGPIFYLFEHKMSSPNVDVEIHPNLIINQLPSNLYVIATMNTADRSLAVVDFALRRRFAWYTMKPKAIKDKNFFDKDFYKFHEIFSWYADSKELLLEPGQGYFIASSEEEMNSRIKYELLPLIKEYLQEGFLANAKEEFNTYFLNRINTSIFE